MNSIKKIFVVLLAVILIPAICDAQDSLPSHKQIKTVRTYSISPDKLPAPFATKSARRRSQFILQPANAELTTPEGFKIGLFAGSSMFDEDSYPRMMAESPNGDVFISDSRKNKILVFRDTNNDGKADKRFVFTDRTVQPFGLAFHGKWLYVANTNSVVRFG